MFRLIGDIFLHAVNIRITYGKGTVARLPTEPFQLLERLMNPPGRNGFDVANNIADGNLSIHRYEQMNVIGDSPGRKQRVVPFTHYSAHVFK